MRTRSVTRDDIADIYEVLATRRPARTTEEQVRQRNFMQTAKLYRELEHRQTFSQGLIDTRIALNYKR